MNPLVLIAGASSESGRAVATALTDAGARVLVVGSDLRRLADIPAVARYECDLSSASGVDSLASRIHAEHGPIDGVVHLVGGWRAGRADDDWAWLESRVVETFRNTSRAFFEDLKASPAGRLVMVSSMSFGPWRATPRADFRAQKPLNCPSSPTTLKGPHARPGITSPTTLLTNFARSSCLLVTPMG